ncbi:MAG TPA: histidine kinase [Holophagaceae bacterium]|nr:histidine kinase [Holophagaceae bacterium]
MRAPALAQEFRRRLRSRLTWTVVLIFWAIVLSATVAGFRTLGLQRPPSYWAGTFFVSLLVCFSYGFLSSLPWRWTGDDRLRTPFPRGILQSAAFNVILIVCLTGLTYLNWKLAGSPPVPDPFGGPPHSTTYARLLWPQLAIGTPMIGIVGALIAMGEVGQAEKRGAEEKLQEAQWVLLRGQLSPHVLFNALNGLAELVHLDPHQAEQALLDLSALYRALLEHGDRPWATLGAERDLVERYLRLETLRLGDRLSVRWDWPVDLDAVEAPPFLLQPLVENALKHGIAKAPEGGQVEIRLERQEGRLHLRVANTGRPTPLVLGNGIGLRNLEARLGLAYGPRAAFRLFQEGPRTVAEIVFPEVR